MLFNDLRDLQRLLRRNNKYKGLYVCSAVPVSVSLAGSALVFQRNRSCRVVSVLVSELQ